MVHFPGFARSQLWIHWDVHRFYLCGFPHSEIPGSMPACGSPRLIAACHVLHRLLLPRHPPCALSSLTIKLTRHTPDCSGLRRENSMGLFLLLAQDHYFASLISSETRNLNFETPLCTSRFSLGTHKNLRSFAL